MAKKLQTRSPLVINCGPGKTEQQWKDSLDINKMANRFVDIRNPELSMLEKAKEVADFRAVDMTMDFGAMVNRKKQMDRAWYRIPLQIRNEFNNNPEEFIKYYDDPNKRQEHLDRGFKPMTDEEWLAKIDKEEREGAKKGGPTVERAKKVEEKAPEDGAGQ